MNKINAIHPTSLPLWRWLLPLFGALTLIFTSLWYLTGAQPISQAHAESTETEKRQQLSPLESEIQSFTEDYFQVLGSGQVDQLMDFYADQIDYYTWGLVDKVIVAQEKQDYFARWPKVEQQLISAIKITPAKSSKDLQVTYLLSFTVENPQQKEGPKRISGQARHSWRLTPHAQGWKIIGEKQRVLSRQRDY